MVFRSFLFIVIFALLACSENMLEAFGDKETDAARYIQAQQLINAGNYDEAISILQSTSSTFQTQREVRALLASAYAGRGGLEFLNVIEAFENAASVNLFPFLMQGFTGGTAARVADLSLAEESLNLISADPAARTEDENVFLALIYLSKIGNILSVYMDDDNDGSLDGSFANACADADTPGTAIDNSSVGEIGLALLSFLRIIPYLSDNFTSGVTGGLDDCVADIESIEPSPGVFPLAGVCSIDDPADYTAVHIAGFRSLIKEDSIIGLGVACTGDVTVCNCP